MSHMDTYGAFRIGDYRNKTKWNGIGQKKGIAAETMEWNEMYKLNYRICTCSFRLIQMEQQKHPKHVLFQIFIF